MFPTCNVVRCLRCGTVDTLTDPGDVTAWRHDHVDCRVRVDAARAGVSWPAFLHLVEQRRAGAA